MSSFPFSNNKSGKSALEAAGNFTIDYLLSFLFVSSTECQFCFYEENVLRATQTSVVSYPAVSFSTLQYISKHAGQCNCNLDFDKIQNVEDQHIKTNQV